MPAPHDAHACREHPEHVHGPGCGHVAVQHGDHVDYLHDGHLHSPVGEAVAEHVIDVDDGHPARCTGGHRCPGHDPRHRHGPECGHEPVPHGDHVDYLVGSHLHHPHGEHCDDHGRLVID